MSDDEDRPLSLQETIQLAPHQRDAPPSSTLKPVLDELLLEDSKRRTESIGPLPVLDFVTSSEGEFIRRGVLGRGGMGVVYEASQPALARDVAIKQIRPERVSDESIASMIQEARITGSLEHPGIMPVHAFGVDEEGNPTLVMKKIAGVSWADLIDHPDHPFLEKLPEVTLRWQIEALMRVCQAVSFAHSRGILHRDIKPENIMLGEFGEVYLVDWGIACAINEATASSMVVGTPHYMAPEMALGESLDVRADVFLLGATLHEVVTGTTRHQGNDVMSVLVNASIAAPATYPEHIPTELAELLDTACAADREDRFDDAEALYEALELFLERRVAVELVEDATARLDAVFKTLGRVEDRADLSLRIAIAQARFGVERALEIWPGAHAAREALTRASRAQLEIELRLKNFDEARAILDALEGSAPDLEDRLESLVAMQGAELERKRALERFEQEQDSTQSLGERSLLAPILALVWAVLNVSALLVHQYVVRADDFLMLVISGVSVLLGTSAVFWFARDRIEWTAYNRRFRDCFVALLTVPLVMRVMAMYLGLDPLDFLKIEEVTMAVVLVIVGMALELKGIWAAFAIFVVAIIISLTTPYVIYTYVIAIITVALTLGLAWHRENTRLGSS